MAYLYQDEGKCKEYSTPQTDKQPCYIPDSSNFKVLGNSTSDFIGGITNEANNLLLSPSSPVMTALIASLGMALLLNRGKK